MFINKIADAIHGDSLLRLTKKKIKVYSNNGRTFTPKFSPRSISRSVLAIIQSLPKASFRRFGMTDKFATIYNIKKSQSLSSEVKALEQLVETCFSEQPEVKEAFLKKLDLFGKMTRFRQFKGDKLKLQKNIQVFLALLATTNSSEAVEDVLSCVLDDIDKCIDGTQSRLSYAINILRNHKPDTKIEDVVKSNIALIIDNESPGYFRHFYSNSYNESSTAQKYEIHLCNFIKKNLQAHFGLLDSDIDDPSINKIKISEDNLFRHKAHFIQKFTKAKLADCILEKYVHNLKTFYDNQPILTVGDYEMFQRGPTYSFFNKLLAFSNERMNLNLLLDCDATSFTEQQAERVKQNFRPYLMRVLNSIGNLSVEAFPTEDHGVRMTVYKDLALDAFNIHIPRAKLREKESTNKRIAQDDASVLDMQVDQEPVQKTALEQYNINIPRAKLDDRNPINKLSGQHGTGASTAGIYKKNLKRTAVVDYSDMRIKDSRATHNPLSLSNETIDDASVILRLSNCRTVDEFMIVDRQFSKRILNNDTILKVYLQKVEELQLTSKFSPYAIGKIMSHKELRPLLSRGMIETFKPIIVQARLDKLSKYRMSRVNNADNLQKLHDQIEVLAKVDRILDKWYKRSRKI